MLLNAGSTLSVLSKFSHECYKLGFGTYLGKSHLFLQIIFLKRVFRPRFLCIAKYVYRDFKSTLLTPSHADFDQAIDFRTIIIPLRGPPVNRELL